jgi:hypothetical protein
MRMPSSRTASTVAVIAIAVLLSGVVACRALNRSQAAKMLNIEKLPASVSGIDCTSYGLTDVLERCAFKIAPADFDALLCGYQYVEPAPCSSTSSIGVPCDDPKTHPRTSHSYGGGPAVGHDFAVGHYYVATPKEFERGGDVTVLSNASRSSVMIDLYIE